MFFTMPAIVMAPLALIACWFDISQRRLPNWLVLVTLIVGMGLALIGPGVAVFPSRLGHAVIALFVGMGLYRIGLVGAGDAKFYAAVAAWFDIDNAARLVLGVSLSGFLFAIFWIVLRRLSNPKPQTDRRTEKKKLPFGVAIAVGAFAALML